MKKKIIISTILVSIIVLSIVIFIMWNNKTVSTITLDINPSIEINLTRKEKVKSIVALNDDAKDVIPNDLKGKSLEDTLDIITNNIIEKGYVENDFVEIILYSKGQIESSKIESSLVDNFGKRQIATDIIVIDNVSKEDEEIAKKYNISPAKASYIKSMVNENEDITIDDLANKSVNELKESKERGRYCPKDYTLDGDWCIKEIDQKDPIDGKICPDGYYEYKGKCYEEVRAEETGKVTCPDGFRLENDDCIKDVIVDAVATGYSCSKGEVKTEGEVGIAVKGSGDANNPVCVDPSSVTHPVTPCELPASDPTERMSSGGKCYWHRAPVIAEGCPGKIQVDGFCWDSADNVYLCPNGNNSNPRTKDDYCYVVYKDVKPVVSGYKCENDMFTLDGDKCIGEEREAPFREMTCPSGFSLVNGDRCLNLNNSTTKKNGLICEGENVKLKNNVCIIYETIEAKQN